MPRREFWIAVVLVFVVSAISAGIVVHALSHGH